MPSTAIVASQILDSGLTGRQLVQSATQSEAITVLGLDPSNYALLDSNNTFTGTNTFDDDVTVNAFLLVGSAEFSSVTINDDLLANNAEFSGPVEFTDLITGVGGEHQGALRITNADLIVTGSGKIDAVDGDFSGILAVDDKLQFGATDTNTFIKHISNDWLYWAVGGLTMFSMSAGGANKAITFNSNENQDIDFRVGYNGGRAIDMDGATGRVAFGVGTSTEVGGSNRLFNLGSDGDTDTEYLETVVDTDIYCIRTGATGSGTAIKKIYLGTGFGGTNYNRGLTIANSSATFNFGGIRLEVSGGEVKNNADSIPYVDGAYSSGKTTHRWSNVYSVDGDFSGDLTLSSTSARATINATNQDLDIFIQGARLWTNTYTEAQFHRTRVRPSLDGSSDLGSDLYRWGGVFGQDGSFSGNLNVETGGSQRLYNLGAEGDTDTEYLEIAGDTSIGFYKIQPRYTGAGRTSQVLRLTAVQGSHISLYAGGQFAYTHAGVQHLYCDSNGVAITDLDVSGTVTTPNVTGTNNLYLQNSVDTASVSIAGSGGVTIRANNGIAQQFLPTGVGYRIACIPIFDGTLNLGLDTNRWGTTYSVDGSFSGNLNVETGGSQKLYNLGTEGDTDTEFVSMGWFANDFEIIADKTGTGTVQDIDIAGNQVALKHNNGTSISTRLSVDSSSVKVWRDMYGGTDGLYNCGLTSNRWANVASVNGDFSGTLNASIINDPTNTFIGLRVNGSEKFTVTASYVRSWANFIPTYDGTIELGLSSNRWEKTWSVGGDFSGTVTISGLLTLEDELNVTGFIQAGSAEMLTLTVTDDIYANNAEFSGTVTAPSVFNANGGTGININANDIRFARNGFGDRVMMETSSLRGVTDNTMDLGVANFRWANVFSYDGSFSGNLNVESGGSYKLYNLGTDGDTDTEYLGIDADANTFRILSTVEGTGVQRDIRLGGYIGTAFRGIRIQPASGGMQFIYNNANRLSINSTTTNITTNTTITNDLRPALTDTYTNGTTALRWSDVYSVDGDFSGDLTVSSIVSTGGLDFDIAGIYILRHNGSASFLASSAAFYPNNSKTLGTITKRWGMFYGSDASLTGNLNVESGGSYRLYNLGTEGDADTEYLETAWDTNTATISTKTTGTGADRNLTFEAFGNNRLRLDQFGFSFTVGGNTKLSSTASDLKFYTTRVAPFSDNATNLGTTTNRWSNVASVDGDFSGTVRFGSWEDNGLTGYVETVVPTTDDGDFYLDRKWSGGSPSGRTGIRTDYNSSGTAHNSISLTPTLAEISLANALKAVWQVSGNLHRLNMNFRPYVDSTYDNGFTNARWLTTYSVNGSFSGNLNVEVGGSYKLYRLGTEGDADTSFFEISNTGSDFLISGKKTGAGTSSTVTLGYEGGDRLEIGFSAITVRNAGLQPDSDSSRNLGLSTRRWARTYTNTVMTDVQTITAASDSLVSTDHTVLCDCTSNSIAIAIPASSTGTESNRYEIKKIDSTANTVTITPDSPATIDGAASQTLNFQHQSITLVSDGSNWFIV